MQRILILGATSAIAAEVARIHASRGARLHLVGRNVEKLADVARRCESTSVTSTAANFANLTDNEMCIRRAFDVLGEIDVALIAHGELGDQVASERSFAGAEGILITNLLSAVSLLIPLANRMESVRHGQLGVITSVAGDRGRPRNYTYGAAKGGLSVYLQGLRTRLNPAGVRVTNLKLGPVDTPMTRDHHKHSLFSNVPHVAQSIIRAMEAGIAEAYVPSFWGVIMPIVKKTPERLFQRISFLSGR